MKRLFAIGAAVTAMLLSAIPTLAATADSAVQSTEKGVDTGMISVIIIAVCAVLMAAILAAVIFFARKNMKNR